MTGDRPVLLLVEDSPGDVRLLEESLEESGELAEATLMHESTLQGALERLRAEAPDVILLDLHLPDSAGDETVHLVTGAAPSTPVVVLTGSEGRDQARRALRAGAEDYLIKGRVQPSDLERSIRYSRERKQAELSLRRSQARYRALFEDSPDGVLVLDRTGTVLEANDRLREIFGYPPAYLRGKDLDALLPDARSLLRELDGDSPDHRLASEPGAERRPATAVRQEGRTRDGSSVPVEVRLSPVRLPDGHRLLATVRDLTEQRALEREADVLSRAIEDSVSAVALGDLESRLTYVNSALLEIWGRPVADLVAEPRSWLETVHPEDRERVSDIVLQQRDPEFLEEYRIVRPDGEVRWVRDQAFPVLDADGRVYRVAGVARDVTEQKRMEEELRHQALHDALTGLPNRALFEDRVEQALARARRGPGAIAVLMADLNRFKRINDSLGHTAGDRVLEEVARRLRAAVREQDTVARWGGDEFCVLLTDVEGEDDLKRVRDRLMRRVRESVQVMDEPVPVDMTVGAVLADFSADADAVSVSDWEDLVRYADQALHRAQKQAGGAFRLYRGEGEPSPIRPAS